MKKLVAILIIFVFVLIQCTDNENHIQHIGKDLEKVSISSNSEIISLTKEEALADSTFQFLTSKMGKIENDDFILKKGEIKSSKEIKLNWRLIKKVKKGNYESFTMLIEDRSDLFKFSNIIFEKIGSKENIYRFDYIPSLSWILNHNTKTISDFGGKIEFYKLKKEELTLKTAICETVEIEIDYLCPCHNHSVEDRCSCYQLPSREISTVNVCWNWGGGGGSSLSPSSDTPNSSGGGGTADIYTSVVDPYDNDCLSGVMQYFNDQLGIELLEPSDEPNKPYLIDLKTHLTSSEMVGSDMTGGYYYLCQGNWIYYRNGQYWVDLSGQGNWYKANLVTTKLSDEINQLIGQGVVEIGIIAARYALPIEDAYILWTGEDLRGVPSSQTWASGFLLFELVPGSSVVKALKPVVNTLGSSLQYFVKYGDELLDLARVNGVIKFTESTIQKLAVKATKNLSSEKVLLGKWVKNSADSYEKIAANLGWCHFDLGDDYDIIKAVTSEDEMWKVNKQFLDNCKSQNKTIYFYHNPFDIQYLNGGYLNEINYIQSTVFGGRIEKDAASGMWKVIF